MVADVQVRQIYQRSVKDKALRGVGQNSSVRQPGAEYRYVPHAH